MRHSVQYNPTLHSPGNRENTWLACGVLSELESQPGSNLASALHCTKTLGIYTHFQLSFMVQHTLL